MLIGCWNIRGLNQPQKQKEIVRLIQEFKLDVIGIIETKVKISNQDKINSNMIPSWKYVTNCQVDTIGRIWIGWNPDKIKLSVLHNTNQIMHVQIENLDLSISFHASFIYGLHTIPERRLLWRDLKYCVATVGSLPWISLGDFNVVLNQYEVFGSNPGGNQGAAKFNDCVKACCLVDLRYTGCFFSWNNRRSESEFIIKKKLDRALVNQRWLDSFPTAFAEFLQPGISDHSPIVIHVTAQVKRKGMPFKFYNYWTSLEKFYDIVHEHWSRPIEGTFQFQLFHKLRCLKVGLKSLAKDSKGREKIIAAQAREELFQCQSNLDSHPSDPNLRDQEKHLMGVFLEALRVEEEVARQKSRIQ